MIKSDEKTTLFLAEYLELKKLDWLAKQEKLGLAIDTEDLESKAALGDILPWEQELIPNYGGLVGDIDRILANRELIEQVAGAKTEAVKAEVERAVDPF